MILLLQENKLYEYISKIDEGNVNKNYFIGIN